MINASIFALGAVFGGSVSFVVLSIAWQIKYIDSTLDEIEKTIYKKRKGDSHDTH